MPSAPRVIRSRVPGSNPPKPTPDLEQVRPRSTGRFAGAGVAHVRRQDGRAAALA